MRDPGRSASVVLAVSLLIHGCGDDTTSPTDDFLPIISNTWENTANQDHSFSLASGDDGEPSGTFTGIEDHPTLGEAEIEGTFQNSTVSQFLIRRSTGNVTYTGKFLAADTLRLTRDHETLLIARRSQ
jgi:hypothetical protein